MQPHWTVTLDDETTISYGEVAGGFGSLPLDRVREVSVTVCDLTYRVVLRPTMRPIYFVQHEVEINSNTGASERRSVCCVGWQQTIAGRNVKAVAWITADGQVVLTDRDWTGWSSHGAG